MAGAIAAFVAWYPQLKRIWPLLLTLPFFFSPRSLSSYLVDLVPIALVAALSVDGEQDMEKAVRHREACLSRPSVLVVALACVGLMIVSVVAFVGPPLQLSVRSISTSHAGTELDSVTISVVNRTPDALVPHFLVNTATSQNDEGFWTRRSEVCAALGPRRLRDDHVVPAGTDALAPAWRAVVGRGIHGRSFVAEHVPLGHVPRLIARPRAGVPKALARQPVLPRVKSRSPFEDGPMEANHVTR